MRILQIGLSKNIGGIETFVMRYYREMVKIGICFDFGDEFLLMLKAIEHTDKIGHLDYDGAFATIHSTTGLSSYDKKIETENDMLEVKSRYFNELSRKDVRFIKMRHYAVLAVAYKKGKKYAKCLINLIRSFFIAPIGFFKLYSGKCR